MPVDDGGEAVVRDEPHVDALRTEDDDIPDVDEAEGVDDYTVAVLEEHWKQNQTKTSFPRFEKS
ncbi:MAG TPA: hypothetical protein V6D20_17095 [Candidatus Obscuribacterales bacterium]